VHVTALALDDAVHGCGVASRIKWPNDIVVEVDGAWCKLAGILIESSLRGSAIERAIVGIGLNVNTPASAFVAAAGPRPTSLAAVSGASHDRAAVVGAICQRLEHWLARWRDAGFADLRPELVRRSATLGGPVRVAVGERVVDGTAIDIAADGTPVVEDAAGQRVGICQPLDS
jgi:BirA family transcriptional regulator, biotin operon repressor / biotin---[acetyl-CoA-carboxylase] ligase